MADQPCERDVLQEAAETIRRLGNCTSGIALGELLMALADGGRWLRLVRLQSSLDSENTHRLYILEQLAKVSSPEGKRDVRLAIRLLDEESIARFQTKSVCK